MVLTAVRLQSVTSVLTLCDGELGAGLILCFLNKASVVLTSLPHFVP